MRDTIAMNTHAPREGKSDTVVMTIIFREIYAIYKYIVNIAKSVYIKAGGMYFNLLKPNDIYIYIYMSYLSANFQTLHFKYLFNKYTY